MVRNKETEEKEKQRAIRQSDPDGGSLMGESFLTPLVR